MKPKHADSSEEQPPMTTRRFREKPKPAPPTAKPSKESAQAGARDELSARRRDVVFANLILTCFALALLSTALNTTLPQLTADLGVAASRGQLIVSGYALALAVFMPLSAFLVTRFPTKPLYCLAAGLFALSVAASALAPGFWPLMAARIVQACANALVSNLTQVSIISLFPEGQRGQRMGWFGFTQGAAPVIAPAFGGFVADAFGWRAVFWFVFALALASFVLAVAAMGNILDSRPKSFDVPSFALSAFAVGGISLGLSGLVSLRSHAATTVAELAVGLAAAIAFALRQGKLREPFLKVQLLERPQYRTAVIGSMAAYFISMGSSVVLPLHLQTVLGLSASASAAAVLPGAICMALISPLAGKTFDKHGIRPLAAISFAAFVLGCVGFCALGGSELPFVLSGLYALPCCAFPIVQMPLVTWGNSCLEQADMPHGLALLTLARNVAGSLGIAVGVALMQEAGLAAAYACMAVASLLILLPTRCR